jgi:hypothetical protein
LTNPLQHFVAGLLEQHGALVEPIEPEGIEVLAPAGLQRTLALPELARLGFGATLPNDAQRVALESDWMERLAGLLGEHGRWSRRILDLDVTAPGTPERILQHNLQLTNATYRFRGITAAWTRYWILGFRYTAISDERRDGLLQLGFNLATGATLDGLLEALLDELDLLDPARDRSDLPQSPLPQPWSHEKLNKILQITLKDRVGQRLQPFFKGMLRRQSRDLERLYHYHGDLRRECLERLRKLPGHGSEKQQADRSREEQRLQAIAREHRAKVDDLQQKYAMKVEIEWIQTLELIMPVQRFDILIRRRKGERTLRLDWNPLARRLEQAPCEVSYTWERPREVMDGTLQLVFPQARR